MWWPAGGGGGWGVRVNKLQLVRDSLCGEKASKTDCDEGCTYLNR